MSTKTTHTLVHNLVINSDEYLKGSKASRKEINMAKREMRSMLTPAEKLEVKLTKLGNLAKKDARFQELYNESLRRGQKELKQTNKAASQFTGNLKAMAGAYISVQSARALWGGFTEQIDKLDALGKQAQVTGASVEFLSRTQAIAGRVSGLSAEQTSDAINDMMEKMGEAVIGAGEGYSALRNQLGMTDKEIRKIAAMRPEAMWNELRKALQGARNEAERISAANKIFGSNGKQLASVLGLQNDAYQEQIELAERLNQIRTKGQVDQATKTKNELDAAKAEIDSLKAELTIAAAPAVSAYAGAIRGRSGLANLGMSILNPGANSAFQFVQGQKQRDEGFLGRSIARATGKNLKRTPEELAEIQRALAKGRQDDANKKAKESNQRQASTIAKGITSGVHALMMRGKGLAGQAESLLGSTHIRVNEERARTETQIRRDQSGPMSSIRGGSMEAFNLLNQVSSVRSVEVEMAKTTAQKSVETVTLLEQIRDLQSKNVWERKEYEESSL